MPGDNGQSANEQGSDIRSAANRIEGLLDDDGQFNPNPERISRAHPDYDETTDSRSQQPQRDEKGRFRRSAPESETMPTDNADVER